MATSFGDVNKFIQFCNDNKLSINIDYFMSNLTMDVSVSSPSSELNCEIKNCGTIEKFIASWLACLNTRLNLLNAQTTSVGAMLKLLNKY